jgi:pimeloyl-ACP methyl ester carboxylesterase
MFCRLFVIAVACLALHAQALAQTSLGVIMLHGKQGYGLSNPGLAAIGPSLQAAGHKVVAPTMAWGRGTWETIDVTVEDVLVQLDGHASQLRGQGAGRIVAIGHSLGAAVALTYAVERGSVAGIAMLSPGHVPYAFYESQKAIRADVDRARALIAQGKGNEMIKGADVNQGSTITMNVRAAVYYSWMNPTGIINMTVEAPRLPATTPLLMVVGEKDIIYPAAQGQIYKPAAKNPYSKYITNGAGHIDAPMASAKAITDWVLGLPR